MPYRCKIRFAYPKVLEPEPDDVWDQIIATELFVASNTDSLFDNIQCLCIVYAFVWSPLKCNLSQKCC